MRLLVSVASPDDAREALAGGADIIDAKDPGLGALGAVTLARLGEIRAAVGGGRLVTAALGDATDEGTIECSARAYAEAGAGLVKVGLLGTTSVTQALALAAAAVRGAATADGGVVMVAYADASRTHAIAPIDIIAIAARSGARGVLLDTVDKDGPGLLGAIVPGALDHWISAAHTAGLLAAVAGRLTAADVPRVLAAGADIVGVRGAACVGGRSGHVSPTLVRALLVGCTQTVEAGQCFG